ncbi:MAG: hypothetical protein ACE15D_01695 [Candidatus Eisenbacteria bacterium]|nr:hypothetical protein [Candidatus Eisenbacteria bacterium]
MSARRLPSGGSILRGIQFSIASLVAVAALWGLLGGCREQSTAPIDRNSPPETFLTSAPGDSQTTFYRVRLYWSGADRDGAVTGYDVAITDSLPTEDEFTWRRTQRTDSLITFQVEETREVLGHRFYVRAVDNEGKIDETPAWVFFGARDNVPPEVHFYRNYAFGPQGEIRELTSTNPDFPTDTIPYGWGVSFAWSGSDGDRAVDRDGQEIQVGRVERFFRRLLPIESEWMGGTLSDTTAQYDPEYFTRVPSGSNYAMQVRAQDDGGLSGSGFQTISFVWNQDPVTRIQRCDKPGVGPVPCFRADDVSFFSGDTIPLPIDPAQAFPNVTLEASSHDPDPPDGDPVVTNIEWRSTSGAVFNPWRVVTADAPIQLAGVITGDYVVMARGVDKLDRVESTPDTLLFFVNLQPLFVSQADSTATGPFQQTPMPGDSFRLEDVAGGLPIRFLATDRDARTGEQMRYGYRFDGEFLYRDFQTLNQLVPYETLATPPGGSFQPGTYKIWVRAEDNSQQGGSSRGTRSRERSVVFRVVANG